MYNFYQSPIWREINDSVYKKPVIYIQIFDKEYQWIIWEKKFFWATFKWIQILGVYGLTDWQKEWLKKALCEVKKKYNPIFIQIWFTDVVENVSSENVENGIILDNLIPKRIANQRELEKRGFIRSTKENLPASTYFINTNNTREHLWGKLWHLHKSLLKKAVTNGVSCWVATEMDEYNKFFDILEKTSKTKGFNTLLREQFLDICQWCEKNETGFLYIAEKDDKIVWWSLYLVDPEAKTGIYLYWWTDRSLWNIGIWQAVNWFAICDLQDKWIQLIDLLWWGPIWDKKHPLYNVGLFKEWFWWEKLEFLWSYDIVYNKFLYTLRKKRNQK